MLHKKGFLNSDIYYISPQLWADFTHDGLDDKIVDAPFPSRQLTTQDIQEAFDWAESKGELNQPLYIFFTDHGGNNRLQLAPGVYIEAHELKQMLDDYQQSTKNKAILVIDACHSGTLVQSLAGPDRAIISSTDDGLAYFDTYEDQNFIYFVTQGLFKGMNFVEAFHYATSAQKKLLGKPLTISVTEHLAYGYDLYVALFLPDGQFTALKSPVKDSNGLQQQEYNQIYWGDRWMDMHRDMGRSVTVMDMQLPLEKLTEGCWFVR